MSKRISILAVLAGMLMGVLFAPASQAAASGQSGLVSEWQGNGNANDSVGTSNGTLVDGSYTPGRADQAFSLDGTNDYVSIPSSAMNTVTGAISVSAWVDPVQPRPGEEIFGQYDTHDISTGFDLSMQAGGTIQWFVVGPGCDSLRGDARVVETLTPIPVGQWTEVAGTFDPATQQLHILINGQSVATQMTESASVPSLCQSNTPLRIGAGEEIGGSLAGFFNGAIQDVQLYNTDISGTGGGGPTTTVTPTVNTLAAQNIGETFATLTGTLNTYGRAAYYRFELDFGQVGTGATYYGFATPTQQALPVDGNQPVYAPIGGLIPGASYNFTLVASSDSAFNSPTLGNILAFQTTAPPMTKKDKGFIGTLIGAGATVVGGVVCGVGVAATPVTLGASDVAGCAAAGLGIVSFGVSLVEPPDSNYDAIFRPIPFPIHLKLPTICIQVHTRRGSTCTSLQRAARGYWAADGRVASLAEALGVTVDRFGGAENAASTSGEALQRSGILVYLTQLRAATAALHAAGRRLASQLGRDHYDPVFSARQIARGRHNLSNLKGMPSSIIRRLIQDGIVSSKTDVKRLIVEGLTRVGKPHRVDLRYLLTH